MKKYVIGLMFLCPTLSHAVVKDSSTQEVYLGGSYSLHELYDETGHQFSAHFGAKNFNQYSWFIGGEVEGGFIINDDFEDELGGKEKELFAGNVLGGYRIGISDAFALDLYAIAGYAYYTTSPSTARSLDGFRYGAGIDAVFNRFQLGLRYTQADLPYDLKQNNVTLMGAYKFDLNN